MLVQHKPGCNLSKFTLTLNHQKGLITGDCNNLDYLAQKDLITKHFAVHEIAKALSKLVIYLTLAAYRKNVE